MGEATKRVTTIGRHHERHGPEARFDRPSARYPLINAKLQKEAGSVRRHLVLTSGGFAWPTLAAATLCALLFCLGALQLSLAAGAPVGRFAWGGQHQVLPTRLRIGSVVSTILYVVFAGVILDHAGVLAVLPEPAARIAVGVIAGLFLLGAIPNLASRSMSERYVMAPLTLLLSVLSGIVALG